MNGFELEVIGRDKPKGCLKRWRRAYHQHGESGLLEERRGVNSGGRPSNQTLSTEKELKRAKAKIAFLEAEIDFLKKLDELERRGTKKN